MSSIFKRHLTKIIATVGAGACFSSVYGATVGFGVFFALWALMPFVPYYDK